MGGWVVGVWADGRMERVKHLTLIWHTRNLDERRGMGLVPPVEGSADAPGGAASYGKSQINTFTPIKGYNEHNKRSYRRVASTFLYPLLNGCPNGLVEKI